MMGVKLQTQRGGLTGIECGRCRQSRRGEQRTGYGDAGDRHGSRSGGCKDNGLCAVCPTATLPKSTLAALMPRVETPAEPVPLSVDQRVGISEELLETVTMPVNELA